MAASEEQMMSSGVVVLQEFVEMFQLPKISQVVGGQGLKDAPFGVGEALMLRTLAVESVGFRFYDADAGSRREVRVPVDNNFKFHVVQDYNSPTPKVYPTVADLLEDCPTVFRANTEVMTKNGRTLQCGSVLKFVRKIRSIIDRSLCLECKDSAGTNHSLPLTSQGNFTVTHDPSSYTLQDIISLGAVERTLRLSNENKKFAVVRDSRSTENDVTSHLPVYDNVQTKDAALSRITGLPLTFKGNIYMQRPELFLLASPADDFEVRWKIALDSGLHFTIPEEEKNVDYEEPIKPELVLKQFVEEFEQDFPVIARVGRCDHLHEKFQNYLTENLEVLVHRVDKVEKLLCSISDEKFCISERVKGRLRKSLTRFQSLSELMSMDLTEEEVKIKMMEDIAADVPVHFSLKAGDIIIFKNFHVFTVNVKLGKKSYGKFEVVSCEKILEDETKQKLQLPLDLEADFIKLPKLGEESGFDINMVFSKSINLPLTVDFIPTCNTEKCFLPTDQDMTIENLVIDSVAVISPMPRRENGRESALSARLKFCLLLPLRSDINLRLEERLQFPPNYFIFPRRHTWIEEDVEKLSEGEYGFLTKYNDSAYEDYSFRQAFSECDLKGYNDSQSEKSTKKSSKKLKKKVRSATELQLDKIDLDKVTSQGRSRTGSESDLVTHAVRQDIDDENIYETFEPGKRRKERRKSETSLKSRIKRRVSKIF
ncbi:uncharacterized protein LOC133177035 [Saccostrea echinata]|uniref:uncharacterized protein LOC133177035 n=1 Tax=Saccostrea echinata TaxID=191078 RepID=UPI002A7F41D1|nr:uncharacterized protein LOC133177035 [Saccostrea echinata]